MSFELDLDHDFAAALNEAVEDALDSDMIPHIEIEDEINETLDFDPYK